MKLSLDFDDRQERVLSALQAQLDADPAVRATSGRATRQSAVRYLVYQALGQVYEDIIQATMERDGCDWVAAELTFEHGVAVPVSGIRNVPETDTRSRMERGNETGNEVNNEVASEPAEPVPSDADPVVAAERRILSRLPDNIGRPLGLEYYDEDPWQFVESQQAMHDYYAHLGWVRIAVGVPDGILELYWTGNKAAQGAAIWNGRSPSGARVKRKVDEAMGVVHIVPPNWDGEPVNEAPNGDVGIWSPGGL
jgi:hypothetical protein